MKTLYENKFKEITAAYEVLMDKSRRETYDSLRMAKMRETEQSNPFAGRQGAHYEGAKRTYTEGGSQKADGQGTPFDHRRAAGAGSEPRRSKYQEEWRRQ